MSSEEAPITGLDEIRAMIDRGIKPPMMELLDLDLSEVSEGRVVFTGTPSAAHYNPLGIVHGGYAATLLDSACGLAANSATKVPTACITLELKISYHAAMHDATGKVSAIGTVVSMGRRVAHTEARLVDEAGRIYASATSTLLLSDRKQAANA